TPLSRDVVAAQRRQRTHEQQFTQPPLLVLSNLGLQLIQLKLVASMFQNMFPSINVHRVNLNNIKRCLLLNYNPDTQLLDFRHYSVKVVPVGVSRGLKKLLQEKFPNMSRLEDISELLVKDIDLSESEAEQDGTHNVLELPQAYAGRGNMKEQQSAVRLSEIGPRMTLQLIKVEEGLAQGNVLYHSLVHKDEEQLRELLARREAKLQLKAERRRRQQQDVERKRRQREAHREKSLAGMTGKRQQDGDSDAEDPGAPEQPAASDESDAEYYRQELGQEPDADLFPDRSKRKRNPSGTAPPRKRRRHNGLEHPDTAQAPPGTSKPRPGTSKAPPGTSKPRPGTSPAPPGTSKPRPGTSKAPPGSPSPRPPAPGTRQGKLLRARARPGAGQGLRGRKLPRGRQLAAREGGGSCLWQCQLEAQGQGGSCWHGGRGMFRRAKKGKC
ncbi:LOW QUALITY PROTEIN: suppressor of SWI4 1 homolog, partial [Colius striatus]